MGIEKKVVRCSQCGKVMSFVPRALRETKIICKSCYGEDSYYSSDKRGVTFNNNQLPFLFDQLIQ